MKQDTLSIIIQHGLSIRQIPLEVVSLCDMRHHKEGNEIVEHETDPNYNIYNRAKNRDNPNFRFEDKKIFRRYTREVTTPKNAGFWMCKKVTNTSSSVQWYAKTDNLAPTLEKSAKKFLAAQNK